MKKGQVAEVAIFEAGARGVGVGKLPDGRLVFVNGAVPGDTVLAQIRKSKKRYLEGFLEKVLEPSPLRVDPACAHFGICGGCKWQNLAYPAQLEAKFNEVINTLKHQGGVEAQTVHPILASQQEFRYRNKTEFSAFEGRWLTPAQIATGETFDRRAMGFHPPGRWDRVIQIDDCFLQPETGNAIRNFIYRYALDHSLPFYEPRARTGSLRSVMLRSNLANEWMVVFQFADPLDDSHQALMDAVLAAFPQVISLHYAYNPKANDSIYDLDMVCYAGVPHLTESMPRFGDPEHPLHFSISPKSFFQTNPLQAERLYHAAIQMADLKGDELVFDLYTGTGTIAQYLAHRCRTVVGVEGVPAAIEDARKNAALNGISNATFLTGDMKNVFNADFLREYGQPDLIVTDPPREGMHPDVVAMLLQVGAPTVLYISCNPATQARDLALMKDHYDLVAIQPVDMFPHTHHVENIALLRKR
jgi:23S rRNA (uracil1939-C5)-methyltransferase